MTKVEGKLVLKDNILSIDATPIEPGSIVHVKVEGLWVELCIERTLGVYYSIPSFDLFNGHTARMDD